MKPRGRRRVDLDASEVVRLRDELGMSWRKIGKRLNMDASTVRRTYARTLTTSRCVRIQPSASCRVSKILPESVTPLKEEPNGSHEPVPRDTAEVFAALWSAWRAVGAVGNLCRLRDLAEMNFRQAIAKGASVQAILEGLGLWISWWDNTGWQYCQQNLARAIQCKAWLTAPPVTTGT